MRDDLVGRIVREAKSACLSFAGYQRHFFDFARRPGWAGWENWLTVEVGRRLNTPNVLPFYPYPKKQNRRLLDLFACDRNSKVAVEIKVNYVDDHEIKKWKRRKVGLPDRVLEDRDKLQSLRGKISRLLLVSTCFESPNGLASYPDLIDSRLRQDFQRWRVEWHDCSVPGKGWNLLLVLSQLGVTHHRVAGRVFPSRTS